MVNEIKTLKDLKIALKDIPDEVLDEFGAGAERIGVYYVALLCWGDEGSGLDLYTYYAKQIKKYPVLDKISKWIENIAKEQEKVVNKKDEPFEREEPISSDE